MNGRLVSRLNAALVGWGVAAAFPGARSFGTEGLAPEEVPSGLPVDVPGERRFGLYLAQ